MGGRASNRGRIAAPLVVVAAFVLLALAPVSATAQTVASTLRGETLVDEDPAISESCNGDGSGTVSFTARGVSTGPRYPGTFTATGTYTIGSGTDPESMPIESMTETFTIDSPNGQVSGEKTNGGGSALPCGGGLGLASGRADYTATIALPTGEHFLDRGVTDFAFFFGTFSEITLFRETFQSHLGLPEPCEFKDKPGTDKDKCKVKKAK